MRVILAAISFILFISCKNKEYKTAIDENVRLKEFYKEVERSISDDEMRKYIKTQLLLNSELYMDIICYHYTYRLFNNSISGGVLQEYKTDLKFYSYVEIYPEKMSFTIPSKNKSKNEQELLTKSSFSFIPNDTGMYYWSEIIEWKNGRKDDITKFFLEDSVYVYE